MATPSAAPVCRAALRTAAATPARPLPTVPMAGAVAAGEMKPEAIPIASIGATASQYDEAGPAASKPSAPAAYRPNAAHMDQRRPQRLSSRLDMMLPSATMIVMGRKASPAASGE